MYLKVRKILNPVIQNPGRLQVTINHTEQVRHTTEVQVPEVHPEVTGLQLHLPSQAIVPVHPEAVEVATVVVEVPAEVADHLSQVVVRAVQEVQVVHQVVVVHVQEVHHHQEEDKYNVHTIIVLP